MPVVSKQQQNKPSVVVATPPPPKVSNQIDLSEYMNQTIAIMVHDRVEVQTKFGERPVSRCTIVTETGDHETGNVWASHVQTFEIGTWYAGKLVMRRKAWVLEPLQNVPKSLLDAIEQHDVPF